MGEPRDSVEKPSAGKLLRSDRDFEAAREAARLGNLSYILGYLATGGGVSRAGGDGKTLLHDASDTGQTAIVVELLSAGADIYARCSSGDTPSDLAARNGHHDVLALLLCHPDIAEPPSLRRLNVAAEEPSRSPEPPTTAWGQTAVAASGGGGGGGARNKMRFRSLLRPWRNKASVKSQNATESVPGAAADNQPRLPRKGRGRRPELREDPGAASDAVGSSPTTMAEHPHGAPAAFFVDGHHGWDAGHDSYGYTTCWDEPLRDSRWSADWPSELSPGASYGEAAPGPVQASSREVDLDGRVSPSFRRPFNWWAHQAPCSCPPARAAPPLSRAASPGDPRSHLPIFFPSVQTRSGGVECPASSVDVAYRELPRETWPENNSARGAVQPTEGAPRGTGNMSDMINTAFYGGNTLPASSNGIAPWNNGGLPVEDHTRAGETGVPTTNKAAREQDSPPPGGRSEPLEGETIERSTTGSSSGSSSGSETRSSGDSDNDYLYSGDDTSSSSESGSGEPRDSWSVPEKPSRLSRSFNHSRSLRVFESVDATAFPATRPILAYVTPNGVMPSSSPAVDGTCGFTRDPRHFQAGEADPPYPGEPHFIYGCGGADAGSTSGRQPPWFSTQPMAMMCQEMHAEALDASCSRNTRTTYVTALRETSRLESPRKINNGIGALEYGDDTFGQQFDRVSYVQDGDHNISREIRARGPAASRPVPENPVVVTSSPAPTSVQEPSSVL